MEHFKIFALATLMSMSPAVMPGMERLEGTPLNELINLDYALVSVDWDHGIRSALPLAEELVAAGITCVLWEPRGSNSTRVFCTHGLQESADVPRIIEKLEEMSGRKGAVVIGVGRGFGAELMLQAAAKDSKLHAVVSIDAVASLNKILKRSNVSTPMRELIGWRMNQLTGLEPFDIAAAKSASHIDSSKPVLLAYIGAEGAVGTLDDSVAIYTQLKSDHLRFITPRTAEDAPDATTRTIIYATVGGTREIVQEVPVELAKDEEDVLVEALKWINDVVNPLQDEPQNGLEPRPARNMP